MGQSILGRSNLYSSGVDRSELERLGKRFDRPAGQILIEDGEDTDHALFLLSGYVKIEVASPNRAVAIRPPLSFVGEMASIDGEKRSARVTALTDVSAVSIPGDVFLRYLHEHSEVLMGLLRETNRRFLETSRKYVGSDLSSELKIARTLIELFELGVGVTETVGVKLQFSQRDLGELSGMSRESAAKALGEFKRQGLVQLGRGSVTVLDVAAVRGLVEVESER